MEINVVLDSRDECVELSLVAADKIVELTINGKLEVDQALLFLSYTKPARDHLLSIRNVMLQKSDTFPKEVQVHILHHLIPFLSSSADGVFNSEFLNLFYSMDYSSISPFLPKWMELKKRNIQMNGI